MKTKEELNALKEEVKIVSEKLAELNDEELSQVVGGEQCGKYNTICLPFPCSTDHDAGQG